MTPNELQPYQPPAPAKQDGCFCALTTFNEQMEAAKTLASAGVIPDAFRNKPADCLIALDMALRIGISPFQVFQNLYVVKGKPAFSGQFYIACINKCGRFTPLKYQAEYDKQGHMTRCRVLATEVRTAEVCEGPWVSIEMAKAEGWYNQNPKWRNMPEMMLRYRAASFFAKTICPDVTMGFQMDEEVIDAEPVSGNGIKTSDTKMALESLTFSDKEPTETPSTAETEEDPTAPEKSIVADFIARINAVTTAAELQSLGDEIARSGLSAEGKMPVRHAYQDRQAAVQVLQTAKSTEAKHYEEMLSAINNAETKKKLTTFVNSLKMAFDNGLFGKEQYFELLHRIDERVAELNPTNENEEK